MWIRYNANPRQRHVGDCAVRAVATATKQDWEKTYVAMCLQGLEMYDMPSANAVWGEYLKHKGFIRRPVLTDREDRYTVRDFCAENCKGVFVLALPSHVICVIGGDYYDTWDSGDENPIYYWYKEDNK